MLFNVDCVARRNTELVVTGRGLAVNSTFSALILSSELRIMPTGKLLNNKSGLTEITTDWDAAAEYCTVHPMARANTVRTIPVHSILLVLLNPSR